jgi:hypothetical protein
VKRFNTEDYFHFMKNQILLLILASLFAQCYEKFWHDVPFKYLSIKKSSILLGSFLAIVLLYICAILFKYLPLNLGVVYLFLYHFLLAVTYWAVIIILSSSGLMRKLIAILQTCIDYRDFFRLFVIFNISFFILILAFLITASQKRNVLETIFIIIYFEVSFLVFHIASAHLIDFIWTPKDKKANNVSLLGLCIASVIYAVKLNIIDRKLVGSFVMYDKLLLTAIVALILFWVFFTLLFHLEWKNLLMRNK